LGADIVGSADAKWLIYQCFYLVVCYQQVLHKAGKLLKTKAFRFVAFVLSLSGLGVSA
jgi:hypothetical protein